MKVRIFVEGIADTKFLKDYISYKYNIQLEKEDIIETDGWTNIYSNDNSELIKNKMAQNTDDDGVNLLIFDADNNFSERLKNIASWRQKTNLNFEIFLWPNNSDAGDIETVLENIINTDNTPIFNCWKNYEICLRSKSIKGRTNPLTTPAKKTKIYGYLEALLGETKSQKQRIKERNRNYKNTEFWDLDSGYLNALNAFLDKHFS
ncbi:MAG: hypothetical protein K8R58_02055 [Bacteroidales bacterium]|nr:hypothetical protein [Bacteroidales bacterium]